MFRYYAFDDTFVREVLGKKLSKGTKKDLDDISAKTGVTLKSCRRQVKCILSSTVTVHVSDKISSAQQLSDECSAAHFISKIFILSWLWPVFKFYINYTVLDGFFKKTCLMAIA